MYLLHLAPFIEQHPEQHPNAVGGVWGLAQELDLGGSSTRAVPGSIGPLLAVPPCGYIRDTHAKGLSNPPQLPDRLITAGPAVWFRSRSCKVHYLHYAGDSQRPKASIL